MKTLERLMVMAFLGGAGALLGAAAGEGLFLDRPGEDAAPTRAICLVFDLSESMLASKGGVTQLESLRRAALDFVARPEFRHDSLSLVGFASDARLLCAPTALEGNTVEGLRTALAGLRAGGMTDIGRGLDEAREVLQPAQAGEAWILLFTDGKPQTSRRTDPVEAARLAARACRESGIHIVAVGTGLADRVLLEELAGDPASVFLSAPGDLVQAFRSSGEHIQDRQMLASKPAAIDLEGSLLRACGWAALVGFGAGLALVLGHNRHLRRSTGVRPLQVALVLLGAAVSGLAAGAAGQGLFYALSGLGAVGPVLRMVAWILLGSGVVLGMSFFVPNLPRGRALVGGALGGAAAVACFVHVVPAVGDTPGRLLGAAILGLMAGAMTVLVEASVRRARLVVHWPGGESSSLTLGPMPIIVGHSARAHICPSFDEQREPVVGAFTLTDAGVRFEDRRSGQHRSLRGGDRLTFEQVVVEVRVERAERPSSEPRPEVARKEAREPARGSPRAPLPQTRRPAPSRGSARE